MSAAQPWSLPAAVDTVLAVPRAVWTLVPERLIRKHRAFPVAVEAAPRGRLAVAMANPGDLAATDEIAFATGLRVVPVPAPAPIVVQMITLHLGLRPDALGPAAVEAIELPEDTGRHVQLEDWLVPTGANDSRWR